MKRSSLRSKKSENKHSPQQTSRKSSLTGETPRSRWTGRLYTTQYETQCRARVFRELRCFCHGMNYHGIRHLEEASVHSMASTALCIRAFYSKLFSFDLNSIVRFVSFMGFCFPHKQTFNSSSGIPASQPRSQPSSTPCILHPCVRAPAISDGCHYATWMMDDG